ncbi:MAG: hypothetical protein ACW96S_00960 [Promethearchaeota archaeon]|jgi:hypothetical protein
MNVIEFVSTALINILPILILFIPYLFMRKKVIGKLYLRVFAGVLVFYTIYWVLPIIFQIGQTPQELEVQPGEQGDLLLGIGYIVSHFGSLLTQFSSYPLVTLPFIFFVSPFISLIMVRRRLKKEMGAIKDNLRSVTYQITESPSKRIRDELIKNDWTREKEILKLLIVLLPVSLYLLQVIIKISGPSTISLESSLGWFLEILFVYLATFIFSVELLFSSKISLKGKFFGEDVREQTYKSLYTVGAPISILSLLLFIVDNINNNSLELLPVIIFFFAYFIMASIIFILFLKIFEPISIIILIKLIDWWKKRDKKEKERGSSNLTYVFLYGVVAIAVYFLLYLSITGFLIGPYLSNPDILTSADFLSPAPSPTLTNSLKFDLITILGFVNVFLSTIIVGVFLARSLRSSKNIRQSFYVFVPIIVIISLFVSGILTYLLTGQTVEYWLTGQTSFTSIFGYNFYILRSASYDATLVGVTRVLSIPYLYTRYVFGALIWGLLIYYYRKQFKAKSVPLSDNFTEKVIFSTVREFPAFDDYKEEGAVYLLSLSGDPINYEKEREEIRSFIETLGKDKLLEEVKPKEEDERKRFYFTLKYLYRNNAIKIWKPEYSYVFEPVEKQGLYIIYEDGRGVFNYAFRSDDMQDPGLVSGMFSAITSFVKEMTKSAEALKKIDHGDITILLEYGNNIFGALFIKGTQSSEVRMPLKDFVQKFEEKYGTVLKDWTGALSPFQEEDNDKLVEDIFKED